MWSVKINYQTPPVSILLHLELSFLVMTSIASQWDHKWQVKKIKFKRKEETKLKINKKMYITGGGRKFEFDLDLLWSELLDISAHGRAFLLHIGLELLQYRACSCSSQGDLLRSGAYQLDALCNGGAIGALPLKTSLPFAWSYHSSPTSCCFPSFSPFFYFLCLFLSF